MQDSAQYIATFLIMMLRYFVLAGIPFLILYILYPKAFSKSKIQSGIAKRKDFLREIAYSAQSVFVFAAVGLLVLKSPLKEYTLFYENASDYPLWWIPISVLLAFILQDTYFYWMHRTVHHPKLYRQVHLVHHKSINPSPWTSYSFHFLEAILEALIAPIVLFLIPLNLLGLILFTIGGFVVNVYGHLGFEIAPKWLRRSFLFEVVNTSVYHNMHHSKFQGNYGLYFRFWDRIMGTEYPDYVEQYDKIQERRFGKSTSTSKGYIGVLSRFLFLAILVVALVLGFVD